MATATRSKNAKQANAASGQRNNRGKLAGGSVGEVSQAKKALSPGAGTTPTNKAYTPAKSKGFGCNFCPIFPTIRGVQVGVDFKGCNAPQLEAARKGKKINTHRVEGTGPKKPQVLVVLEKPSPQEDTAGVCGEGRDARAIRRNMKKAGVDISKVRFTYAVRCYSPGQTRDTAVKACNGFLSREIDEADPEVIVPVGSIALKAIAGPSFTIESCAGTPFKQEVNARERVIVPMWSSGYIHVFEERLPQWYAHFDTLGSLLRGETEPEQGRGKYKKITCPREAAKILDSYKSGFVATDLETNTLTPADTAVSVPKYVRHGRLEFELLPEEEWTKEEAKISVVSWTAREGEGYYVLRDHIDTTWTDEDRAIFDAAYVRFLKRQTVTKLFWNGMFECTWFKNKYGTEVANFIDVMMMHVQFDENLKHSLKDAASQLTGMGRWDEDVSVCSKMLLHNYSIIPDDIIGPYAGCDVDATLRIFHKLRATKRMKKKPRRRYVETFYPALISALSCMQARGVTGDKKFAKFYRKYTRRQVHNAYGKIMSLPEVRRYQRHKHRNDPHRGKASEWRLNLGSTHQVRDILFDMYKYEPFKLTDSGEPSTDAESLNHYINESECPFSAAYLTWREFSKLYGTYAKGLLAQMRRYAGRIHGGFLPHGTATGRLSSRGPNLQNQPDTARRMYVSRFRTQDLYSVVAKIAGGKVVESDIVSTFGSQGCIISLDYSQIEVRVAACISEDPLLLEVYLNNEDVHTATMCRIFNLTKKAAARLKKNDPSLYKKYRTIAKRINFGVIYGIGAQGVQRVLRQSEGIEITLEEAQAYIAKFFETYTRLDDWIGEVYAFIEKHGKSLSPFGRVRNVPSVYSDTSTEEGRIRVARAKRQGMNAIIQGAASDMTLTSIILIHRELKKRKMKAKLIITVHDSIVLDAPISEVAEVVAFSKDIMENLPKKAAEIWGDDFDWSWVRCPIVAEAEVGFNWRDTVPFDPTKQNPEACHTVEAALLSSAKKMQEKDGEMRKAYEEKVAA